MLFTLEEVSEAAPLELDERVEVLRVEEERDWVDCISNQVHLILHGQLLEA